MAKPNLIDEDRLLTIYQRFEEIEGQIERGAKTFPVQTVKFLLGDVEDLTEDNHNIKRLYNTLKGRKGAHAFRRQLELDAAMKRARRSRCGMSGQALYLSKHYLERYPELSYEQVAKYATGEEIGARGFLDRLYRAGYKVTLLKVRVLVPHFNNRLEPIPIPDSMEEARAQADGYDIDIKEPETDSTEEESEGVG